MVQRTNRPYARAARLGSILVLLGLALQPATPPGLVTGTASQIPRDATAPAPGERSVESGALLPVGRQVMPPAGYIGFCLRNPAGCTGGSDHPAPMHLSSERWRELNDINDFVNRSIPERDDLSLYGMREYWAYADPDRGGDCEDLALLKQRLLTERGWPLTALSVAVVRQWNGEGHAVLLVATDRGDLVLDNMTWKILPWRQAPYEWLMRQSHRRPYIWVALDPDGEDGPAVLANLPPPGTEPPFMAAARRFKQMTASLAETRAAATP
ncbi:transglutaminase-like cysteine peptidase [Parvibaculum sp. MBR-TMA-1.3b-4.2]|jgi:predicted transglutaminase-like cysteine proteinase